MHETALQAQAAEGPTWVISDLLIISYGGVPFNHVKCLELNIIPAQRVEIVNARLITCLKHGAEKTLSIACAIQSVM